MDLIKIISAYYTEHNRNHLPWRKTRDPYKILVSEIMLQQTQVERVIPKYREFTRAFPNFRALARAPFSQVLFDWNGLGYNRRAKYLHEASKVVVNQYGGTLPKEVDSIEKLPGIGPYTARAVSAFAYNEPAVFIETNIRTVYTQHYFLQSSRVVSNARVSDTQLLPLIAKDVKRSQMEPRDFYAALMDYGAHLKQQGVRINSKSKHYAKQSKFEGSARQLRGAILRELLHSPLSLFEIQKANDRTLTEIERELGRLEKEGLIQKKKNRFSLTE